MNTVMLTRRKRWAACVLSVVLTLCCGGGAWGFQARGVAPEQVQVSVKIIEFSATKGVETGLSAFFQRLPQALPFGRVRIPGAAIEQADLTFPTSAGAGGPGITVFLDRIRLSQGAIELALQALVDENRLFILSRPRAMVKVGEAVETVVKTSQEIPYEDTRVVGNTVVQVTSFEDTGVILRMKVHEVIDDDGDWSTNEDTYIRLELTAEVKDVGIPRVVALDDQAGGNNSISVPEFATRRIATHVWVRDGQVLIMGGLYRNTVRQDLSTLPGLTQAEDAIVALAERAVPGNFLPRPLSPILGSRERNYERRELVFMIKSEIWRPFMTIRHTMQFDSLGDLEVKESPKEVISGVMDKISDFPRSIFRDKDAGSPKDVRSNLGRRDR